ncbi:hypothetical protein LTR56_001973 [Elasticomyces elasticus]|nr:hypothetical protein LTR56_001973 [Elasticomyces elasticus]KAK4914897.1 hypothetical protein LTR49_016886 [Elasticomyces elasticus]KAK5749127.1 hypothetical protein LTS12_020822 [Elasticomyces elasticus]
MEMEMELDPATTWVMVLSARIGSFDSGVFSTLIITEGRASSRSGATAPTSSSSSGVLATPRVFVFVFDVFGGARMVVLAFVGLSFGYIHLDFSSISTKSRRPASDVKRWMKRRGRRAFDARFVVWLVRTGAAMCWEIVMVEAEEEDMAEDSRGVWGWGVVR